MSRFGRLVSVVTVLVAAGVLAGSAPALSTGVVISQVYGGGGNTGATYTNDFIELFNRGSSSLSLAGWSVQYASAAGTTWQVTTLAGNIAPGQYFLIQEAAGTGGTTPLPTPDATGTILMSATAGKVALVNSTVTLSGACPTGAAIVDFAGYGATANCFEGSGPTPAPSNTTAVLRGAGGCTETDSNSTDFAAGAPTPRNTASALAPCGGPPTLSINDVTQAEGNAGTSTFTFSVSLSMPAGAGGVTFDIATQNNTATTADSDYVSKTLLGQTIPQGSSLYTFDVTVNGDTTVEPTESFFVNVTNVTGATVSDGQGLGTISNDDLTLTLIHDIQGATHISPMNTQSKAVRGIVTGKRSNGFYMQEENADADANDATSEGIFVFTSSAPTSNVGDDVTVTGTVTEFRPGGSGSTNLTTTELGSPSIITNSSGNPLPTSVVIGSGGRVPPNMVIEDDSSPDIETGNTFDPASDGIDFYESLEGMLATVNNPVAVGPTSFGEIPVLANDGAGASVRTARLGIVVRSNDFNPERIILDDEILLVSAGSMPLANVSDHLAGSVTGVFDYSFGNFKLELTSTPTLVSAGLTQETAATPLATKISIATFNVENLDPGDGAAKFNTLAGMIVNNLKSPDIVALEEIQDNNGPTNDSVTDASTTFNTLIGAITGAGGPTYAYQQIDPVDDQDGGEPGGNIRVGFIYRTDRGVSFVSKPGATPTTANSVNGGGLVYSPGRIDPTNAAFTSSRKPLAAEFMWNTQKLYLIANHFNSKGGDDPLFGRFQPPVQSSQTQRNAQATVVNQFVDDILANDLQAQIVVLGDFNDFEFSSPLLTLTDNGTVLKDLYFTLPQSERYSYVFDGNSQALDHILVDNAVSFRSPAYDVVHVNSEFANQASDHEPQVLQYDPTLTPTAVGVRSFAAARAAGGGVVLRWRTAAEVGLAGFNVYRGQAGHRVRLNRRTIPVHLRASLAGHTYSWRDRSKGAAAGARYWLEIVRVDGSRAWRGPVRVAKR